MSKKDLMPVICTFCGIKIYVYYENENPPHFHANYGDYWIKIAIKDGKIIAGDMPKPALKMILNWLAKRRDAIQEAWDLATNDKPPKKIPPLR